MFQNRIQIGYISNIHHHPSGPCSGIHREEKGREVELVTAGGVTLSTGLKVVWSKAVRKPKGEECRKQDVLEEIRQWPMLSNEPKVYVNK